MNSPVIVVFAYNRLSHLKKVMHNLQLNDNCSKFDIIIYSDNFKCSDDSYKVKNVRNFIKKTKGFKSINIVERNSNFGLAKSIITGVTEVLNHYDSVIVLEDDIVPCPFFLMYMKKALELYNDTDNVGCVHAYSLPCSIPLPETFFLKGADCWGWGTWRNSWNHFENDGSKLIEMLIKSNLCQLFDLDGAVPYTQMLRDQISGKNNSWAILWHASMFLANKLCLHPGKSLVKNIGFDSTGTNCVESSIFDVKTAKRHTIFRNDLLKESILARNAFKKFYTNKKAFQEDTSQL